MTLDASTPLILDGGMGRELKRMGAPFRQPEWSALALMESPEHVRRAHQSFVAAGADLITTNSYALVPFHIGEDRFRSDGPRLTDLAGRLAREVADAAPRTVRVAGSLPPVFGSYRPDLFEEANADRLLGQLVAGLRPHVDLWLAETQSSIAEVRAARRTIGEDGKPFWVSFTLEDEFADGVPPEDQPPRLRSGEPVAEAVAAARALGAAAILFNCSQPEVMRAAVAAARAALADRSIPIGVYANAFPPQTADAAPNAALHDIRADLTPERYRAFAADWIEAGADMVGGCCGIGPEHLHALARGLKA